MGIFVPEKMFINTCVCSLTRVINTRAPQLAHVNWYTTRDLRDSGIKSLGLNILLSLNGENITFTFKSLQYLLIIDEIFFPV